MSKVRYKQSELPLEARKAKFSVLVSQPDGAVDLTDIPALDENFWSNAIPNQLFKPINTHASAKTDADVMEWLESEIKGYQTRMNAIFLVVMLLASATAGSQTIWQK